MMEITRRGLLALAASPLVPAIAAPAKVVVQGEYTPLPPMLGLISQETGLIFPGIDADVPATPVTHWQMSPEAFSRLQDYFAKAASAKV